MFVIDTLAPIFLLILLGVFLRKIGFAPPELLRGVNRLVYYVAAPVLLFLKGSQARVEGAVAAQLLVVLIGATLISMAVAYLVAGLLRMPRRAVGAFVQGAFRSNAAFIGLPVVLFSLASRGASNPAIEALAALAVPTLIITFNIVSVIVLLSGQETAARVRRYRYVELSKRMVTNPLILGCVVGLVFSFTGWMLPTALDRTVTLVSQIALPLALMSIGGSLTATAVRNGFVQALPAALLKVGFTPIAGYAVGRAVGLPADVLHVAVIYLACPTAIASFVMAEQLGSDEKLAGSIIVISVLLSIGSLALALLLT